MAEDTIRVGVNGPKNKNNVITISKSSSIEVLLKNISDVSGIGVEYLIVLFAGKQLQSKKDKKTQYIADYGIIDLSDVFIVVRQRGWQDSKRYGPGIPLSDEPDMLTLDKDEQRGKMPCGHPIGPTSLTDYCEYAVNEGQFVIKCPSPGCKKVWDYPTVRKMAVLTLNEKKTFEKKLSENVVNATGIKQCPKCNSYCARVDRDNKRVACWVCQQDGNNFEFCWFCLLVWKTNSTTTCGNSSCDGGDKRVRILRDCDTKTIVGVPGCPSRRACPNCGLLIEHEDACKQMDCYLCHQQFCFICLKKADSNGRYQCGNYNSPCDVAPRQSEMPSL